MQDNNIYLYFGNNETAAGKIYHRKQAHFFEDQFIDKSATGRFFYVFVIFLESQHITLL